MSTFEHIVRPYETGIVTPPENIPTAQIVRARNVILNPGNGGVCKTMGGSFSLTEIFYMINRPTEITQQQQ